MARARYYGSSKLRTTALRGGPSVAAHAPPQRRAGSRILDHPRAVPDGILLFFLGPILASLLFVLTYLSYLRTNERTKVCSCLFIHRSTTEIW